MFTATMSKLPARHPWRGAVEPYRVRRADALIDIGERLRMTGLIFNFSSCKFSRTTQSAQSPAADNRLAVEAQIRSLLSDPLRLGMQPSLTLYWL